MWFPTKLVLVGVSIYGDWMGDVKTLSLRLCQALPAAMSSLLLPSIPVQVLQLLLRLLLLLLRYLLPIACYLQPTYIPTHPPTI